MNENNDFINGKITPALVRFAIPIFGTVLLQFLYGIVDMLIIGNSCDKTSVSAISVGSLITYVATVLINGLISGFAVLLGNSVGKGDKEKAGEVIGTALAFFGGLAVVMTIGMALLTPYLVKFMKTPEESFDKTVQYVFICSLGMVFIIAFNLFSGFFRGIGNSKIPLLCVFIACLINIVGDIVLINGFHMDVAGAAIATIFAQAMSVLLSFFFVKKQKLLLDISLRDLKVNIAEMKKMVGIGLPIGLQDTLTQISFMLINSIINEMGLDYSAGYGVAVKVVSFILLIPTTFMMAISTFVAQNVGAKQIKRAQDAMKTGMKLAFCIGLFMFALGFFGGTAVAGLIVKDKEVSLLAGEYLRGFSLDCLVLSILFGFCGYFNGCGKTKIVMFQGLFGAFIIRVPLAYIFKQFVSEPLMLIGLSSPISSALCVVICLIYYKVINWEKQLGIAQTGNEE